MTLHRASLILLYLITIVATAYLAATGAGYYGLEVELRPDHSLHESYKPSGFIGHGLGIVGSLLIVMLLLYSARKRFRRMQAWGNIRYWLNYHIWMGVTGPLLVIFHTTFKFGGIVAVSFWSMIGVALSGVVGRYIYIQIPRSRSGHQLSAAELDELDREMMARLSEFGVSEATLAALQSRDASDGSGWGALWRWFLEDLAISFRLGAVRKALLAEGKISRHDANEAIRIIRQRLVLRRRIRFLHTAEGLLHYWHVIHKPFAIVMLVIMVIHVAVALLFGYAWIWKA